MLTKISILTSLSLGIFYPLCLLIHSGSPIKHGFHRFHLGFPLVVGGVAVVYLLFDAVPLTKGVLMLWFLTLTLVTVVYWKREYAPAFVIAIPSLIGLLALFMVHFRFLWLTRMPFVSGFFIHILAGLILCASLHSMMLGHHYLNAKGLPMKHLGWASTVLWVLLGLRIVWDLYFLFYGKILYEGDLIALVHFLMKLDGFLLWIGIFFGTLLPFVALFFVKEILKLKNTQAATGLLYVVLCSVLMGDLAYKYYLVKFGVAL